MKLFDSQRDFLSHKERSSNEVKLSPGEDCSAKFECTEVFSISLIAKRVSGDGKVVIKVKSYDGRLIASEVVRFSKKSSVEVSIPCNKAACGASLVISKPKKSAGSVVVDRVTVEGSSGDARTPIEGRKTKVSSSSEGVRSSIKRRLKLAFVVPYGIYGGGEIYLKNLVLDGCEDFEISFLFLKRNRLYDDLKYTNIKRLMLGGKSGLASHLGLNYYDAIVFYNSKSVYDVIVSLKESGAIRAKVLEIYHSDFLWVDAVSAVRCRKFIDKIIRVSDGLAEDISGVLSDRKVSVPVSVDLDRFSGKYPKPSDYPKTSKKVIGIVSRLSPEKNISYAIKLASAMKGFFFICIGEGAQAAKLRGYVSSLGINNFKFLGYKDNVEEYYAHLDALILTSKIEGLPISIAEAVVSGVPVFSTDVGQIRCFYKDLREVIMLTGDLAKDIHIMNNFDFEACDRGNLVSFGREHHSNVKNKALFFDEIRKTLSLSKLEPGVRLLKGEYLWQM